MISLDEAVRRIGEAAAIEGSTGAEAVPLERDDVPGRILAEDLALDRDHPPFDRSTRDGVALRAADVGRGVPFRIVGEIPAGVRPDSSIPAGAAIGIATGAAIPPVLDAVVERERLVEVAGGMVEIDLDEVARGRNIHPRGADGPAGRVIATAGSRVDPTIVGFAAAVGCEHLPLRVRPRLAIVATGDELRPVGDPLSDADDAFRIRDSNRPMLAAALRMLGGEVVATVRVHDDLDSTVERLATAARDEALVVTVGGVSVGNRDHVPDAAAALGLVPGIRGVLVQPGRPTSTWHDERGRLRVLALPGNPVSCLVGAHLFARPWLERRLGLAGGVDWTTRRLERPVETTGGRTVCRPARADEVSVSVRRWQGSGDLPHLVGSTGIVRLPDRGGTIPAGTPVSYLPWSTGVSTTDGGSPA